MSGIDYAQLRALVQIQEVLRLAGFAQVEAVGDQLRGPCQIHGSQSPTSRSFSVNLRKHTFRCFKCNAAGNQLDLWVAVSKLPLRTAARDLCDRLGIAPPEIRHW
jgi:DNA primase